MRTFKVTDTLQVEAHLASTSLPVRHLIIRFVERRPFDVIYLSEVKDLIAQLIEATIYLITEEYDEN